MPSDNLAAGSSLRCHCGTILRSILTPCGNWIARVEADSILDECIVEEFHGRNQQTDAEGGTQERGAYGRYSDGRVASTRRSRRLLSADRSFRYDRHHLHPYLGT